MLIANKENDLDRSKYLNFKEINFVFVRVATVPESVLLEFGVILQHTRVLPRGQQYLALCFDRRQVYSLQQIDIRHQASPVIDL